tara:strand:+ start:2433 stop:3374 length:942 start_codon:yes stop_codon:yes gene_type:complete
MKAEDILKINNSLFLGIWSNNKLKDDVSERLIEIATNFFDDLHLEDIEIQDITFTGSLANYNWTRFSDVDLHLIVDFKDIDENYELVREFFNAKTSLWNKMHEIKIRGYEVEIYVQDISEDHHSTGVYSIMRDQWIAQPLKIQPEVDTDMVKRKINSFIDMIERIEDACEEKEYEECYESSLKLLKKIKKFRRAGLEDVGEYSNENLTFKYLRNYGFIKTLFDIRNETYDKMMSISGDFTKKFKIFLNKDKKTTISGFDKLQEESKFQKRVKKRHLKLKKRLIGHGGQRNVPPFTKKPNYRRGKSSPAGFGGT